MFFPPGIIKHMLPEKNRYTNFKNVETILFTKMNDFKIKKFINFIKKHYLQNNDNNYNPSKNNIIPYFKGHNDKCFYSFYFIDENLVDSKTNNIITNQKIIGVITSRPLHIKINNGNKNASFDVYYVDYLCVDKEYRKKGIAPQIIQTHEFNQRHINKNISISLFKREGQLTGIVPLTIYSTYGFHVTKWYKPSNLHSMYSIIEITNENVHFLVDFLKTNYYQFDIIIIPDFSNIIELIKSNNIFIYVIIYENKIICAYFFRKTCTFIESNLEVLTCFASINSSYNYSHIFIHGYKVIFWKIAEKFHFGYAAIENISHNNIIINNLIIKTKPHIISPTAYFFYNFAYNRFKQEKTLIIN
jgi:GNAT superfamily N-acetyltransferase